jgi:predicted transcriptional regulator
LTYYPWTRASWLEEDNREALHHALDASEADVAAGRLLNADDVLKEVRSA